MARWDGWLAEVQIHLFQLARFTDVTASYGGNSKGGLFLLIHAPAQMNFTLPKLDDLASEGERSSSIADIK